MLYDSFTPPVSKCNLKITTVRYCIWPMPLLVSVAELTTGALPSFRCTFTIRLNASSHQLGHHHQNNWRCALIMHSSYGMLCCYVGLVEIWGQVLFGPFSYSTLRVYLSRSMWHLQIFSLDISLCAALVYISNGTVLNVIVITYLLLCFITCNWQI